MELQYLLTDSAYHRILNEFAENNNLDIEPRLGNYQYIFKIGPNIDAIKINVIDRRKIIIDECITEEGYAEKLKLLFEEHTKINDNLENLTNKLNECNTILNYLGNIDVSYIEKHEMQDIKKVITEIVKKIERYD